MNVIDYFKDILAKSKSNLKLIGYESKLDGVHFTLQGHYDWDKYEGLIKKNGDVYSIDANVKLGNLFNSPEELSQRLRENVINEMSGTGGGAGGATFSAGTGDGVATRNAFRRPVKKKKKKKKVTLTSLANEAYKKKLRK